MRLHPLRKLFTLLPPLCLIGLAAGTSTATAEPTAAEARAAEQNTWLDHGQKYVSQSSDRLAGWIDHFFGDPSSDFESANSTLRLTLDNDWEQGEGFSADTRLRGKVHLPRLNKKLSLIFSEEDEDDLDPGEERERSLPITNEDKEFNFGLQYRATDKERIKTDFKVGLNSHLKFKSSGRYRYDLPQGDDILHRFTETVYFVDGEGFSSRSVLEHNWMFDNNHLLRWANSGRVGEDFDGAKWNSRLELARRINRKEALSHFAWTSGVTEPVSLNTSYGLGTRYRRNFYRDWLYVELEPAYAWVKETPEEAREGRWLFTLRFEMVFDDDNHPF